MAEPLYDESGRVSIKEGIYEEFFAPEGVLDKTFKKIALGTAVVAEGTVLLQGKTPVIVAVPEIETNDLIGWVLLQANGTLGAPHEAADRTPGSNFVAASTEANDTSFYRWVVLRQISTT